MSTAARKRARDLHVVSEDGGGLPACCDTERELVGGLALDAPDAREVFRLLNDSDFFDPQARVIFREARRQFQEHGAVDPCQLVAAVRSDEVFSDPNDAFQLLRGDHDNWLRRAHVRMYAKEVAETAKRRRVVLLGRKLAAEGDSGNLASLLAEAREELEPVEQAGSDAILCEDYFEQFAMDILDRVKPVTYADKLGQFGGMPLRPAHLMVVAAPTNIGKSMLVGQMVYEALEANPDLRACFVNCEMEPDEMTLRHVARMSAVDADSIRYRTYPEAERPRIVSALAGVQEISERIAYVRHPCTIAKAHAVARKFGAKILVVDYLQRIPADSRPDPDVRRQVNRSMDALRVVASEDQMAVVAVAAVARQKDGSGRPTYSAENMTNASLRESSEIEYGADSIYFLCRDDEDKSNVLLKNTKQRGGALENLELTVNWSYLKFKARPKFPEFSTEEF